MDLPPLHGLALLGSALRGLALLGLTLLRLAWPDLAWLCLAWLLCGLALLGLTLLRLALQARQAEASQGRPKASQCEIIDKPLKYIGGVANACIVSDKNRLGASQKNQCDFPQQTFTGQGHWHSNTQNQHTKKLPSHGAGRAGSSGSNPHKRSEGQKACKSLSQGAPTGKWEFL